MKPKKPGKSGGRGGTPRKIPVTEVRSQTTYFGPSPLIRALRGHAAERIVKTKKKPSRASMIIEMNGLIVDSLSLNTLTKKRLKQLLAKRIRVKKLLRLTNSNRRVETTEAAKVFMDLKKQLLDYTDLLMGNAKKSRRKKIGEELADITRTLENQGKAGIKTVPLSLAPRRRELLAAANLYNTLIVNELLGKEIDKFNHMDHTIRASYLNIVFPIKGN